MSRLVLFVIATATLRAADPVEPPRDPACQLPFLPAQALSLNLAIGGINGGDPSRTSFPQRHEVDHVRIYQKKK